MHAVVNVDGLFYRVKNVSEKDEVHVPRRSASSFFIHSHQDSMRRRKGRAGAGVPELLLKRCKRFAAKGE